MIDRQTERILFVGYYPGVIGKITELHATYYHEQWGFDLTFETQVGSELSDFIRAFDPARDGFWVALCNGVFAGSVAIDGRKLKTEGARLRWFIVEPGLQRRGIGSALMKKAIAFSTEAGHHRVFLWTFHGLDQARSIYERHGFRLSEEHRVNQWGTSLVEQRFDLTIAQQDSKI